MHAGDEIGRLNTAHSRLSTLIEILPDAILVEDENRRIALMNPGFKKFFGIEAATEDMVGADCGELAVAAAPFFEGADSFVARVEAVIAGQSSVLEEPLTLMDGRRVLRDYAPILTDDGFRGHLWRYRDVTDIWKTRQELEETNDFYRQVMDAMPVQLAVFDRDLRYQYVSPQAIKDPDIRDAIMGRTDREHAEALGRPSEDAIRRMEVLAGVRDRGETLSFEETIPSSAGPSRHIRRIVAPIWRSGRVEQILGFGIDVSEAANAHAELQQSQLRYKMLVEEGSEIIYRTDVHGRITYANQVALREFGSAEKDAGAAPSYLEFVHPKDRRSVRAFYGRQLRDLIADTYLEFRVGGQGGAESRWLGQNVRLIVEDNQPVGFQAVARDITDRKKADLALAQSEERKAGMIASALDCIVTMDAAGRVTDFNPAAEKTFGYTREELLGKIMADHLVPEKYRSAHRDGLARYLKTGEHNVLGVRIEIEAVRRDGSEFPIEMSITPQNYANGELFTAFIRDISEQRELRERQQHARSLVEDSLKAREQFLANMSHEMRTPLNAVIGLAHLLERTELSEEQAEFVASIRYSGGTLLALINDLLDLSKITAGRLIFEAVPFRLRTHLKHLMDTLRPKAREKGLEFRWSVDGDLPEVLTGDPARLTQILLNLVGNAIKFTQEGSVTLSVQAAELDEAKAILRFEVSDTGIGIAPEHQQRIFDQFVQASSTTTRNFGGTGLGLAIVRELVTRQSGSVKVNSSLGNGATFQVELPFAISSESDFVPPATPREGKSDVPRPLTSVKILLAEDNELNRLVASQLLRGWGAEVVEAVDGAEAVHHARNSSFDLAVLDIQMPVMDGLDVARMMRGELRLGDLPILALTASIIDEQRPELREAGIDAVMTKPFEPESLLRQAREMLHRDENAATREVEASGEIDLTYLKQLSSGDNAFLTRLLDILLRQLPEFTVMLEDAVEAGNLDATGRVLHKMKTSAASLPAQALAQLVVDLEEAVRSGDTPALAGLSAHISREVTALMPALKALREEVASS